MPPPSPSAAIAAEPAGPRKVVIDTDTIPSVAPAKPSLVEYPDSDGKAIEGFERTADGITFLADAIGRRSQLPEARAEAMASKMRSLGLDPDA